MPKKSIRSACANLQRFFGPISLQDPLACIEEV